MYTLQVLEYMQIHYKCVGMYNLFHVVAMEKQRRLLRRPTTSASVDTLYLFVAEMLLLH